MSEEDKLFDDWGDESIIKVSGKQLKRALISKHLGKLCECKNRTILVDKHNRRLECSECGAPLDAFDVVADLCFNEHMYYSSLKFMRQEKEELEKWMLNNRMGSALREIAIYIRRGLIPNCPHCKMPFDLDNLTSWTSKEYAEALYQQKLFKKEAKLRE